jgi:uncharacterized protein (DUF362 family)
LAVSEKRRNSASVIGTVWTLALYSLIPGLAGLIYRRQFLLWFLISFATLMAIDASGLFPSLSGNVQPMPGSGQLLIFLLAQLALLVLAYRLRRHTTSASRIPTRLWNWLLIGLLALLGGALYTAWTPLQSAGDGSASLATGERLAGKSVAGWRDCETCPGLALLDKPYPPVPADAPLPQPLARLPGEPRLPAMLEQGLRRLSGKADARAALAQWVRPADTVGLKVNCLAGRHMSTRVELVEELVSLLAATGLPRQNALVFDRSDLDLRRGGFQPRSSGSDYRVLGNDRVGYEEELTLLPSGASRYSRVVTRQASVLINLPVLKDHGLSGLSGALKNNFGLIHNPNKFHLNGCHPHLAEVNGVPAVRRKQRLVVCDALRVQIDGGPAYHPAAAVPLGVLLLATDPVALDLIAWDLLEEQRRKRKLPSLVADRREPVHIAGAARAGLGVGWHYVF